MYRLSAFTVRPPNRLLIRTCVLCQAWSPEYDMLDTPDVCSNISYGAGAVDRHSRARPRISKTFILPFEWYKWANFCDDLRADNVYWSGWSQRNGAPPSNVVDDCICTSWSVRTRARVPVCLYLEPDIAQAHESQAFASIKVSGV